jgi:hypothetical protein
VAILAGEPSVTGALHDKYYWRGQLRAAVKYYSDCSKDGAAGTYCECVLAPCMLSLTYSLTCA